MQKLTVKFPPDNSVWEAHGAYQLLKIVRCYQYYASFQSEKAINIIL